MVLFHFATDLPVVDDLQPGALGQFVIFPQGEGEIRFGEQAQQVRGKAHLMSGFSCAAPFHMRGPWQAIGASLSPLGWAALTKAPANKHVDRFLPAEELLGGETTDFAASLSARYLGKELSGEEACMVLADWIAPRLGEVPQAHALLVERTIAWLGSSLNPDLEDLFDALNYSRRQAERLVERYLGLPPAALARKYRAVRAAALLSQEDLSDAEEAAIAEAFCDQPHMVREIRRYSGYTPTRLGGEGQPIMKTLLQMKNFTRMQLFKAH